MCACEHHWDVNAPCTCSCFEHEGVRREMSGQRSEWHDRRISNSPTEATP